MLFLISLNINAQETNQKKIVEADIAKNGSQIIPENIQNESCDCLLMRLKNKPSKDIEIFWNSNYTDGRYIVVITQNQLYVKSSHENPNPNYLYWVSGIDKNQYQTIRNFINSTDKIFSKSSLDNNQFLYTQAQEEKHLNNSWENNLFKNFIALLEELNSAKLDLPSKYDFGSFTPVRIIYSKKECTPLIIKVE